VGTAQEMAKRPKKKKKNNKKKKIKISAINLGTTPSAGEMAL